MCVYINIYNIVEDTGTSLERIKERTAGDTGPGSGTACFPDQTITHKS